MIPAVLTSLKNLGRNKRRTIITALTIIVGFVALNIIASFALRQMSLLRDASVYIGRNGHIIVYAKDGLDKYFVRPSVYSISKPLQDEISTFSLGLPDVDFVASVLIGRGLASNGCKSVPFQAIGVEPHSEKKMRAAFNAPGAKGLFENIRGPSFWQATHVENAVFVAEGLAALLGKPKIASEISGELSPYNAIDCEAAEVGGAIAADANIQLVTSAWDGNIGASDGEIAGHFTTGIPATEDKEILMSLDSLQRLLGTDNATYVAIFLKDPERTDFVFDKLRENVAKKFLKLEVHAWKEKAISPAYNGVASFMRAFSGFIGVVVVLVVFLSILNVVTIALFERSRELGVLRSLGFSDWYLTKMVVLENIILTILSILVGIALYLVVIVIINYLSLPLQTPTFSRTYSLYLEMSFSSVMLSSVLLIFSAAIGSCVAGRNISRRNITSLLRL